MLVDSCQTWTSECCFNPVSFIAPHMHTFYLYMYIVFWFNQNLFRHFYVVLSPALVTMLTLQIIITFPQQISSTPPLSIHTLYKAPLD